MRIELDLSDEEVAKLRSYVFAGTGTWLPNELAARITNALPRPIQVGDKMSGYLICQCEAPGCVLDAQFNITDEETGTLDLWLCAKHFQEAAGAP